MTANQRWYESNPTLMTIAVLMFVVEVFANAAMRGGARYLVVGLCAGAMLACVWRLSVNNRAGNPRARR